MESILFSYQNEQITHIKRTKTNKLEETENHHYYYYCYYYCSCLLIYHVFKTLKYINTGG